MSQLRDKISRLNREARWYDDEARRCREQAKACPAYEGQLLDQVVAFKLKAHKLRTEADELETGVPHVVWQ